MRVWQSIMWFTSVFELQLPTDHLSPKALYQRRQGILRSVTGLLEGSWDLVSTVISTLSGVISNYKYSYLNYNPSYSVP